MLMSKTLTKALEILNFLASKSSDSNLNDVANGLEIDRSTAHRILASLIDNGLVSQSNQSKRYRLGFGIIGIYQNFLKQNSIVELARSVLVELEEDTGENAHLSYFNGKEIVFLDTVPSRHAFSVNPKVGEKEPAVCTALGKIHLAELPKDQFKRFLKKAEFIKYNEKTITTPEALSEEVEKVKKQGYALDLEEFKEGVRCIASRIPECGSEAVIGISGPAVRIKDETLPELIKKVQTSAANLNKILIEHR